MKHNKQTIDQLKLTNRILTVIVFSALVMLFNRMVFTETIISPCQIDSCFVKVVEAQDIMDKTHQGVINRSRHPKLITHIWKRESTYGTNNTDPTSLHMYCRSIGRSNEFGFGGMKNKFCYQSFEESVKVVDAWLDSRDKEALCYYNVGVRNGDCEYIQ